MDTGSGSMTQSFHQLGGERGDGLQTAEVDDRLTAAVLETMEAAAGRLPDPGAVDMAALVVGLTAGRG